jgi:hypothetical protein
MIRVDQGTAFSASADVFYVLNDIEPIEEDEEASDNEGAPVPRRRESTVRDASVLDFFIASFLHYLANYLTYVCVCV